MGEGQINNLHIFLYSWNKVFTGQSAFTFRSWQVHFWTLITKLWTQSLILKEIVHFEINFWYVLAYRKGIQDVGVFVSAVFSIFLSVSHIMEAYGHHLKEHAQRSPN